MANVFETDRSGILSWQKCPRDRFYSRHFGGRGIERLAKSLPLQFGAAFHNGTEELLKGRGIEAAVSSALLYLDLAFSVAAVDMGEDKLTEAMVAYGIAEQRAIAEGLLRAWWIEKGSAFVEDFDVLEVESEGRAELAPGIVLMFRPDALVREKVSGDLYIVSWKTASRFGQYTINQIGSDMQSMSETWGRMNAEGGDDTWGVNGTRMIEGTLYLFAVKGQRRMDDYLGFKTQDSPLAYCWKRAGVTPEEDEYAWKYKWPSDVEGRKTEQLGKGFRKFPVWEVYPGGVKAWIDALAAREITPRHINPFEAIFPNSLPVSRRADEIESWRRQIVSQESRIRQRVIAVEGAGGDDEVLDREFPQHSARCFDYQAKCAFYEACFTPEVHADPLSSGLYQIRVSNHPEVNDAE